MKTLILTHEDIIKIISIIGVDTFMDESISKIEEFFKSLNKSYERKMRVGFLNNSPKSTIEVMPSRKIKEKSLFKIVNFHETNTKKGFPTVMSTTVLCDEKTGFQEVIAESTLLTYIRTGASAAVAAKHLARKNSSKIGIIGTGSIGHACIHALSRIYKLEKIYAWDIDKNILETFKKRIEKLTKVSVEIKEPEKFISNVDILVTATYGDKIIVNNSWVKEGLHINAVGADTPGKQELNPEILKRAKIIVDYKEQAILEGEVSIPISEKIIGEENIYAELYEILNKKKDGRTQPSEITLFDSTGDPIEDLAILDLILQYNNKLKKGKYEEFTFIPKNPKDPYEIFLK